MQGRDVKILVLKHLADTETAFRAGCELDEEIWSTFAGLTKSWIEGRDWTGDFEDPTEMLRLAPVVWTRRENAKLDFAAGFTFEAAIGDDWERENPAVDAFWVQRLTGVGRGRVGFRWSCEYRSQGFGKSDWRAFVKDHAERVCAASGMVFEDKEGTFFVPVKVPLDDLVKAYESDAIEDALAQFTAALNAIERAAPTLQTLLDAVRARAKRK